MFIAFNNVFITQKVKIKKNDYCTKGRQKGRKKRRVLKTVYYVKKDEKIRVNYRYFLEPLFCREFRRIYVFHESSI